MAGQLSAKTQPEKPLRPAPVRRASPLIVVVVAALLAIGFLAALTSLVMWLADRNKTGPEVALSLQFVATVILLILIICVLVIVYQRLGLVDKRRAMGLPDGSIRAIIALLLIVLFFLAAVFLFVGTQDRPDTKVRRALQGITSDRLAGIPTDQILSLTSRSVGTTTVYDVVLSQAPTNTEESNDIAKQLLTVVGTLVTAVAAFYFGANSVAAANRAAREVPAAPAAPDTGGDPAEGDAVPQPPPAPGPDDAPTTPVAPPDGPGVAPLDLDDAAVGDLEAEQAPKPLPEAPYVEDPHYDSANDAINPDMRGETDDPDTPGSAGQPPDPSEGGEDI
jgi:hypothetical protein